MAVGLLLRAWAAGVLEKDRELAVTGPYAHTRNPLYLGSFVTALGAVVAGGRLWFGLTALVLLAVLYRDTVVREDDGLVDRFGEGYRHYREAVPALLPRIRRYRPPADHPKGAGGSHRPSSARYLRNREYEALIGAALAFGILALKAFM